MERMPSIRGNRSHLLPSWCRSVIGNGVHKSTICGRLSSRDFITCEQKWSNNAWQPTANILEKRKKETQLVRSQKARIFHGGGWGYGGGGVVQGDKTELSTVCKRYLSYIWAQCVQKSKTLYQINFNLNRDLIIYRELQRFTKVHKVLLTKLTTMWPFSLNWAIIIPLTVIDKLKCHKQLGF